MDRTVDGYEIVIGLRVMTNELRWGTVVHLREDGWHDVQYDDGSRPRGFNGERLRHSPHSDFPPDINRCCSVGDQEFAPCALKAGHASYHRNRFGDEWFNYCD